jgi:hypothetical protein
MFKHLIEPFLDGFRGALNLYVALLIAPVVIGMAFVRREPLPIRWADLRARPK